VKRLRSLKLSLVLLLLFSYTIRSRAQEREITYAANALARSLSVSPKAPVAVVDFTDLQGNVTELGRYLADELEGALVATGSGIDLVDRTRLKTILQEYKLASTGLIDPATARKVGNISGAKLLITGTLTPLGNTVRFSIKVLNTTDGRIVAASSGYLLRTPAITDLLNQGTTVESRRNAAAPMAPAPQPMRAQTQPAQTQNVFSADQLQFSFHACERSGGSITCDLTITNTADDRELYLWVGQCYNAKPRLIDNYGREQMVSEVIVGSHRSSCGLLSATLVKGVSTRVELQFDRVPSDSSSIARLDIEYSTERDRKKEATFHNLPVLMNSYGVPQTR
jgi:TolB-like protein